MRMSRAWGGSDRGCQLSALAAARMWRAWPCRKYTGMTSACSFSGLDTTISVPSDDQAHSAPALIISQVQETNSAAPCSAGRRSTPLDPVACAEVSVSMLSIWAREAQLVQLHECRCYKHQKKGGCYSI